MKQIQGIWFPEDDTHFETIMKDDGSYQKDVFDEAMGYVKNPKIFYDIGAHVGLWTLQAHKAGFRKIHAFEPNPKTFQCLEENIKNINATLYNCGISHKYFTRSICEEAKGNSGAVKLIESDLTDENSVRLISLSETDIHLMIAKFNIKPHETLVKIDTEGMEADCVRGMDKIIYALRPVVIVEQKSNNDALLILQQMGMKLVKIVRKDYILIWPPIYEYEYPSVSGNNVLSKSTSESIDAWSSK